MFRTVFNVIILLNGLWFLPSLNAQTYSLGGKVIAGDDQKPLPWANVFISNSSIGTQTNIEGEFKLQHLPPGNFKLVASFVGYETIVVDVRPQEQKSFIFVMKPLVKNLKEVVIHGKSLGSSERTRNMRDFQENFIGSSENARFCKIANPTVLEFKKEALILKATADSLLIIENGGLGYRLSFLLEEFTLNTLTKKLLYKGQVVYERLVPESEKQKQQWTANRLKAYYGSEIHFMRALYQHRLLEEGFFINLYKDKKRDDGKIVNVAVPDTILTTHSRLFKRKISMPTLYNYNRILDSAAFASTSEVMLSFEGQLEVIYIHEEESYDYRSKRNLKVGYKQPQKSRLYLLNRAVTVEPNGSVPSEENLPTLGYWSWELVAESLPIDYDPEEDKNVLMRTKEMVK